MTYMTRQQQAVLDCIAACPGGCATAMVLADRLRSGGQSVGLTTVYRQLERLEKQGLVHKLVTDEGACWQYCDCHAHRDCILLKCEVCGAIQHMDCGSFGGAVSARFAAASLPHQPPAGRCFTVCATGAAGRSSHEAAAGGGAGGGGAAPCGGMRCPSGRAGERQAAGSVLPVPLLRLCAGHRRGGRGGGAAGTLPGGRPTASNQRRWM